MKHLLITVTLCILVPKIGANNNPEELGEVKWLRNLQTAQEASLKSEKPILILFQEIPGCSTCKRYGREVLSHPLLVEAIETLFIPLAIFNNRKGADEKVLAHYGEPSWNNPVVRIVGSNKKDVLPRLNGNYTPAGLAEYMITALKKNNRSVPTYLELAHQELSAKESGVEKTTLSMYCFWTGEKELGKLDGVVHTEAGFMDGREVVNVHFDPKVINLQTVIQEGSAARCADRIYTYDEDQQQRAKKIAATKHVNLAKPFHLDREPKYYLTKTIYQYLPMSPMQAVKANTLVGQGQKPKDIFSPRQLAMLDSLYDRPNQENAIHHHDWKSLYFKMWRQLNQKS